MGQLIVIDAAATALVAQVKVKRISDYENHPRMTLHARHMFVNNIHMHEMPHSRNN